MFSRLKIFTGRANDVLAKEVAKFAGIPLGDIEIFKFSNDESFVKINENVRGTDTFIIQPTCYPVNDNLVELLIMIDALKRASARRINCVIPYFGYARTDKKDQPRVPITAKLIADLITIAGADRVVTVDLHADQIQGFFNIPVDHLFSINLFARHFKANLDTDNLVVVSPDSGGANRARYLATKMQCAFAIGDKRRTGNDDNAELLSIIGEVKGKDAILYDDIIDTGGSLTKVAVALKNAGANRIYAACVHGVLSGNALEKLRNSEIEMLFVTDSVYLSEEKRSFPKITIISIAELLAVAIKKIHIDESLSILFR